MTPTLKGKDAVRFIKNMIRVDKGKLTKQEQRTANRIYKNRNAYKLLTEQKPKQTTDEFWKITELRKLMNLCDNEMETTTMALKERYRRDIKLMQEAEAFGRGEEKQQTAISIKEKLEKILDDYGGNVMLIRKTDWNEVWAEIEKLEGTK